MSIKGSNPGARSDTDIDILKQWLTGAEGGGSPSVGGKDSSSSNTVEGDLEGIASALLSELTGDGREADVRREQISEEIQELKREIEELKEENERLRNEKGTAEEELKRREENLDDLEKRLQQREQALSEKGEGIRLDEEDDSTELDLKRKFSEELREKEEQHRKRERELKSEIESLRSELEEMRSEYKTMGEELQMAKMSSPERNEKIDSKIKELSEKERRMERLEKEYNEVSAELQEKNEELKKLQEMLEYKESEFNKRDEDLLYREKRLNEERRRFEEAKKEAEGLEEQEMKKRLENLKQEIQAKEERIRNREKFLESKEAELRRREQDIIEDEIEALEEERAVELQQEKVKTGNHRLDDLLLGGVPFGSNILIHGPPFTGKEVMVGQFVAEGLAKGVPCIWIITDKSAEDIRKEMKFILSGYEEYEKLGLLRYVDSYSKIMEGTTDDPYTEYIDDPTDHNQIAKAVEKIGKKFMEEHDYYRLVFRSVSTLIAYSDPNSTFRFLSPFCGKRKKDGAVSLYSVEKGMHGEQEIQMLGSLMDGMIDFKVDQLKTYFAVKGITDVQSRSYIRYTSTKSGLSIGSFSLDHIR